MAWMPFDFSRWSAAGAEDAVVTVNSFVGSRYRSISSSMGASSSTQRTDIVRTNFGRYYFD